MSALLAPAPGVDLPRTLAAFGTPSRHDGVEKDDADLARYAEIIARTRPEVIVETGTRRGYSALWFAGHVARVITVDSRPELATAPAHLRVFRLTGDSLSETVFDQVHRLVDGRRTMVSLDSDHSTEHVAAEIAFYADLVTPGCYLVVEDGIYHYRDSHEYDGDPLQAISATMPRWPDYARDIDIEGRYPTTGHIAGWWRRTGARRCPYRPDRRPQLLWSR